LLKATANEASRDSAIVEYVTLNASKRSRAHELAADRFGVTEEVVYDLCFKAARKMFNDKERGKMTTLEAAGLFKIDDATLKRALEGDAMQRNGLPMGHKDRLSYSEAETFLEIGHTTLQRMQARDRAGKPLRPSLGKPPDLRSENQEAALLPYMGKSEKHRKTGVEFHRVLNDALRKQKRELNGGNSIFRPPEPEGGPLSKWQVRSILKQRLPEVIPNPTMSNVRREVALLDPYNVASNAAVLKAMYTAHRYLRDITANMDAMSMVRRCSVSRTWNG
jgi:hypothetical protein